MYLSRSAHASSALVSCTSMSRYLSSTSTYWRSASSAADSCRPAWMASMAPRCCSRAWRAATASLLAFLSITPSLRARSGEARTRAAAVFSRSASSSPRSWRSFRLSSRFRRVCAISASDCTALSTLAWASARRRAASASCALSFSSLSRSRSTPVVRPAASSAATAFASEEILFCELSASVRSSTMRRSSACESAAAASRAFAASVLSRA
mmetsp:Transcript_10418/g.43106  ORF Transcript_10418/g.43106 Transcript_10418/m.43106 type:complete len:211 (-) Transcript_10418:466-1098(-)